MYRTKKGLATYLIMQDINKREGFKYYYEKDLKAEHGEELKTRVNMFISDLDALSEHLRTKGVKGDYYRLLKTYEAFIPNVFCGFLIQDNVNKLWNINII